MLDLLHLPAATQADVQVFTTPSVTSNINWLTWHKPRGKSMVHMLTIGGGGGGGGGFTRASGNGGGGGGGGSSGAGRLTVPSFFLPDELFVQVGAGGLGVSSGGGVAGSGVLSAVTVAPDNSTASNILCLSGSAGATGGGTGTIAAAGAAGTASSIATIGSMALAGSGQFAFIAGQAGIIGAAVGNTAGGAQTIPVTSCLCTGGGSGAGTINADAAGGGFTAIAASWLSEQRPATPTAGSVDGSGGVQLWKPFFSFGGCGGSSSNAGVGGNGGNGAYGAGGGGGGSGTTGGKGGDGGTGIVIIVSW